MPKGSRAEPVAVVDSLILVDRAHVRRGNAAGAVTFECYEKI